MAARKKKSVSRKKKVARKATPRKTNPPVIDAEVVDEIPDDTKLVGRARGLKNLIPFGPNNKPKGGWTAKHTKKKNIRDAINYALTCEIPDDIVKHYESLGHDISGSTFSEAIAALVMRRATTGSQRVSEKALDQLLAAAPKSVEISAPDEQVVDPSMMEKLDAEDLKALHRIREKLSSDGGSDQAA
jgi:hypothetical protein